MFSLYALYVVSINISILQQECLYVYSHKQNSHTSKLQICVNIILVTVICGELTHRGNFQFPRNATSHCYSFLYLISL